MATRLSPEVEPLRVLGRPTDSLPHLPSRPTNMVGLQRPPAVVSWALPPAFGCTACRLRRAGTRNRHAPKGTATPADCSRCPPLCEDGSASVAPTQLFGRLGLFQSRLSSKNYAAPPPGLPPGPLGLLPKPVLRSCGFSFASSLQILVPCPTETAPAKPETCGFRLVCLAVFSGSRSAWRHWATPRMRTQPASRKLLLLASAHRLPSKRATSLFLYLALGRYQP